MNIDIDDILMKLRGRRKSKYTEQKIRQVLEDVQKTSISEACSVHQIHRETIAQWINASKTEEYKKNLNKINIEEVIGNINFSNSSMKYTEQRVREILEAVNAVGITRACEKYSIHKGQIKYWCKMRRGAHTSEPVKTPDMFAACKTGRRPEMPPEKICEVLQSVNEIGIKKTVEKYKITRGKIQYWRNREARQKAALSNYHKSDKDKIKKARNNWRSKNKEHIRGYNKKYYPKYSKEWMKIPTNKLLKHQRTRLFNALKYADATKKISTVRYLGCKIDQLKTHLESQFSEGMSWDNYGKEWHIDHIKPCTSFQVSVLEEQMKCFHYTNLQPMWTDENLSKGANKQNILAIINCGSSKLDTKTTAAEMYSPSKIFTCLKNYVSTVYGDYKILSSYHGLLDPSDIIDPYDDVVMHVPNKLLHSGKVYKKLSSVEKKEWARTVMESIPFDDYDEVRFYCGRYYSEYLKPISNSKCKFFQLPSGHGKILASYGVWSVTSPVI